MGVTGMIARFFLIPFAIARAHYSGVIILNCSKNLFLSFSVNTPDTSMLVSKIAMRIKPGQTTLAFTSVDIAVVEAVNNAFCWADEIEKTGASCVIIDPYKFKIISAS